MKFNRIKAEIRYNSVYVCDRCGRVKVGTTVRVEYLVDTPKELAIRLSKEEQKARDMPFGWSSYGDEKRCEECTKER